jgi:hypothetical protein
MAQWPGLTIGRVGAAEKTPLIGANPSRPVLVQGAAVQSAASQRATVRHCFELQIDGAGCRLVARCEVVRHLLTSDYSHPDIELAPENVGGRCSYGK